MMDDERGILLQDPIAIGDVLQGGRVFEVNAQDVREDAMDDLFLNYDNYDEEELREIQSPWTRPFAELKDRMTQVSEYLWKKTLQPGTGDIVPENCRVVLDYNAFFENQNESFDSTYLRGQPLAISNPEGVLSGIYKAVRTMRLNEEAQFLISYQDLFGALGSPPRIPLEADGLYIMKLRSFSELGDANALDELPESERNQFETVHKKAIEVLKSGLELFKKGNHNQATRAFLRSVQSLELCQLKDEAQQEQQQATLIRLYTNLAVCYNKMEMYNKTCLITKDIMRLCDINQKSKILFCEGRAQLALGNFDAARKALTRCQQLEPRDKKVADELVKLNEKYRKYKKDSVNFWSKAVRNPSSDENAAENHQEPVEDVAKNKSFKEFLSQVLYEFLASDQRRTKFAENFTESEVTEVTDMLVGPFGGIDLATTYLGDRTMYWLVKK